MHNLSNITIDIFKEKKRFLKHKYDVIIDKAPELIEKLDPSCLWPHLIRLQVIDNTKREEIEVSTDYLSKDLSETHLPQGEP